MYLILSPSPVYLNSLLSYFRKQSLMQVSNTLIFPFDNLLVKFQLIGSCGPVKYKELESGLIYSRTLRSVNGQS